MPFLKFFMECELTTHFTLCFLLFQITIWGGPLRIVAANHAKPTSFRKIFTRPWHILQWMSNPVTWFQTMAAPERRRFATNPIIYPTTWVPLRLLQMLAVAKVNTRI